MAPYTDRELSRPPHPLWRAAWFAAGASWAFTMAAGALGIAYLDQFRHGRRVTRQRRFIARLRELDDAG